MPLRPTPSHALSTHYQLPSFPSVGLRYRPLQLQELSGSVQAHVEEFSAIARPALTDFDTSVHRTKDGLDNNHRERCEYLGHLAGEYETSLQKLAALEQSMDKDYFKLAEISTIHQNQCEMLDQGYMDQKEVADMLQAFEFVLRMKK